MVVAPTVRMAPNTPTLESKKRHHNVPVAYLKQFTDKDDRLWAYRKDEPDKALHVRPSEIGFERYYYSQPLEDGSRDHNRVEDFFSNLEGEWPPLVERLRAHRNGSDDPGILEEFLAVMRVRVPAARDMVELSLAANIMAATRVADRAGRLPPKPEGLEDILDRAEVAIDPHRSMLAMPALIQGFGRLMRMLGFQIVHNRTNTPFITSDNPVAYFDPLIPEDRMFPYRVDKITQSVELLFPIAPDLLLRGHSGLKNEIGFRHVQLDSNPEAKRINRITARFGYRFVFASSEAHHPLVKKHAHHSPTIRTASVSSKTGEYVYSEYVFAPRALKRKWER